MSHPNSDYYFLKGGGEMGALIRAKDWSNTPLGDPADWPQSLRTIVAVMLDNPFGMYIAWGREYTQLYNDGYRPILGATKHPHALGISTRETFAEIWDSIIGSMFDGVMEGNAVGFPDLMLPLNRNGFVEECYFDFAYSPIRKDDGEVGGVLVTVIETTNKKNTEEALKESEARFRAIADDAPVFIFLAGENAEVEYLNKTWREYTGISNNDYKGRAWAEITHIDDIEPATKIYMDGFNKRESCSFENRQKGIDGIYRTILWKATPRFSPNGQFIGMMGVGLDIHERKRSEEKLRESESNLKLMIHQAPVSIGILRGLDYTVEIVNKHALELWGRTEQEVLGKSVFTSMPELLTQGFKELLDDVRNTGKRFSSAEMPVQLLRNGIMETVYVNFSYEPLYDADEKINGIMTVGMEVTHQVAARKKVELNEEKLNIIIEASELGIYELNIKTKEPIYSKRYLEILGGYKENIQLTHAQLLAHLHPEDLGIREKAFKDAMETGYLHYEARLIWKDNSIHWMEGKGKMFYDYENKPEKLIGTIRDITEEKNHEVELKKSEEQFSTLADNMENLAWLADGEGWIYWYNKRWIEYTGLTLEEMQGWGWQKVHHPDHVERILEISKNIWHVPESFELTFPLRRHDGEYRWFLTRGFPVTNQEGKIIKWIGTNTDITEQKKDEEQFKVLADQAPMWVWLTDKEVNVIYSNPEVLNFLGLAHYTELTGTIWEKNVHPEEISIVYQSFGEAVSLQQSFSFECRVLNASTHQYEWFYIKAVPRLEAGEITGFIGTGININDQKSFTKELEEKVAERTAELKASEDKFYNLFNLSPICKTLSDVGTGKIVMVNDAFTKLFGHSHEETVGRSSAELGLLDLEARTSMINDLNVNGKIVNKELEFIKKSGERFTALASAEVIILGNKQFFLSAFNDISEIKKAEQNIKQKNEELENKTSQLEEAQQLAHIGSWEWDVVTNKIEWSDELFRLFGLTPQEFDADYESYLRYIHADDSEYVDSIVKQALKDHQPYSLFHKVACADGKVRILSATGKVITDDIGNVIKMSGTAQDVTEQKNYEEELKISEERFYKIFDSNPVPMSLSEIGNSKIKYANNRFYNVFGYNKEEVIGRSSEELNLLDPEENKRVVNVILGYLLEKRPLAEIQGLSKEEKEELLLKLKQSDKMKDFEILYTRKNGEKFPALISYEVIRIGADSYTVASYQDITERKKAEALLRSQNDQLEKMNKELESFAYISSHDLQEPLRKIQTFASRIIAKEANNLSDFGKDMFTRMQESAKRMQTLIQDLLAYSRTDTLERQFQNTDLNKIIAEVKEELEEELTEKHATIESSQLCHADIIPFQFRQLMQNLVSNSLKFSNPENPPHIKITSEIANEIKFKNEKLSPQKKYCHISFSDNGIGFEQQYSEKIFEVFQRLHGKNEYNGTGIGLSIVKKIVENHNGIITAKGELNKGATFEIYIPAL